MVTQSLISLVTAVRNGNGVICDSLDSIQNQETRCHHIVIDGASSDGTLETVRSYGSRIAKLVSEPDQGIYEALNKGLKLASSEIVGFLHADDMLAHSDVLARISQSFANDSVDAVYGDLIYVDAMDTRRVIRYWRAGEFSRQALSRGWMPPHPTLYVRRHWYEKLGGFDTRYRIAGDYDFILRLFSQPNFKAVYIPEVLVKMRVGGASNRSLKQIIKKTSEDYRALRRSNVGGLMTLACKNFRKIHQFWVRA